MKTTLAPPRVSIGERSTAVFTRIDTGYGQHGQVRTALEDSSHPHEYWLRTSRTAFLGKTPHRRTSTGTFSQRGLASQKLSVLSVRSTGVGMDLFVVLSVGFRAVRNHNWRARTYPVLFVGPTTGCAV